LIKKEYSKIVATELFNIKKALEKYEID